ncbi:ANTAR domain-containing protein [Streptomyces turgidiscabies]|uniref:ANTAR domain protein n=1 Tax=Streptomyces turgidiscabies (strain Car8) TaxID=698760 RepID=L7ETJ5_STRT8|nr:MULTISPECIES: ANTAR domain-containing protein [Streptomyces]ELP61715.1 ANTAR domain protein [Streptomyces turgidiscabies Car8]MDX3499410.1 ANTAR domain-containing protein [Streptomyces turgidiscabies]
MANQVPPAPAPLAPPSSDAPAPLLGIETRPEGYATLVVVTGAIDLVTEQALHRGLRQALASSERGIDLDLSGVDFCDCSGLNVLLRLRRHALEEGKIITIRSAGAAALRLFSITGTLPLFAGMGEGSETERVSGADATGGVPATDPTADSAADSAAHPASALALGAEGVPLGETDQDLRIEVVQLRRAMQTRPVIDLARGVLMASFGLSAEDSWKVLVTVSQNTNTKLHEVADSLVGAVTGDALPEAFRLRIAETVADLRTPPSPPEDPAELSPHP